MIALVGTAFTAPGIALAAVALFVAVPLLIGKAIHRADVEERTAQAELPCWLADLDVTDDGADDRWRPDVQAAMRQALDQAAAANDRPDPDFIARTRRLVVDELAQRRGVRS